MLTGSQLQMTVGRQDFEYDVRIWFRFYKFVHKNIKLKALRLSL